MNRDGTGPNGEGPLTGKGLGNCKPIPEIVKKVQELLSLLDKVEPYDFESKEEIIGKLDDLRVRLEIIVVSNSK